MMNIIIRELRAGRKSLIIWSAAIFFMILSAMGKYTSYAESGQSMNELLSKIPRALKAVLGMGNLDMTTASGFYGMFFMYMVLAAAIHASMLGANIISKEERDKTAEFLLVKPVSRTKIITSKLLASLFSIAIFNIVTLFFSLTIVGSYAKGEDISGEICLMMGGMFLLQILFLSVGTGIAASIRRPKASASIAMAVLLFSFVLSSAISIYDRLDGLKYITPFKYFEAERLLEKGSLDPVFVILSLAVSAVMIYVTYTCYKKRDLII